MSPTIDKLRVLSYNIHKGFSAANIDFVLGRIRESIRATQADIVFLQEVVGQNEKHAENFPEWPGVSQFEFLADEVWPHFAYGRNAVYNEGHHGNAILSRFPISWWENEDVSLTRFERRGLLHARIAIPNGDREVDLVCLHLNLFERHRRAQVELLARRIARSVGPERPLVIAGDFNDWSGDTGATLERDTGVKEVFQSLYGRSARTFPSWMPLLRLDRIYVRGLAPHSAEVLGHDYWARLSDHLPLVAELGLP